MMSFLTYYWIFYELWTFVDFDQLCKLEKRGDEIKKKSSLKLLCQSQSNFAEMNLGWSPFKIVFFLLSNWKLNTPLTSVIMNPNFKNDNDHIIVKYWLYSPQVLGDRIPPFFVKKNFPVFFLNNCIRSIVVWLYHRYSGIGSSLFSWKKIPRFFLSFWYFCD